MRYIPYGSRSPKGVHALINRSTLESKPPRLRLRWATPSSVLPVTFEHATACRSATMALSLSATIQFAMKFPPPSFNCFLPFIRLLTCDYPLVGHPEEITPTPFPALQRKLHPARGLQKLIMAILCLPYAQKISANRTRLLRGATPMFSHPVITMASR